MRIVAGQYRGRRIEVPEGDNTRPTSDRVREATFNALYSLNLIQDTPYIDLFAGSGALGLEALSRGAQHVTFIENNAKAIQTLKANIDTLKTSDNTMVIEGDAISWLRAQKFDTETVVLADPPYDFDGWSEILNILATRQCVLVTETPSTTEITVDDTQWNTLRKKRYGSTSVTIFETVNPSADT